MYHLTPAARFNIVPFSLMISLLSVTTYADEGDSNLPAQSQLTSQQCVSLQASEAQRLSVVFEETAQWYRSTRNALRQFVTTAQPLLIAAQEPLNRWNSTLIRNTPSFYSEDSADSHGVLSLMSGRLDKVLLIPLMTLMVPTCPDRDPLLIDGRFYCAQSGEPSQAQNFNVNYGRLNDCDDCVIPAVGNYRDMGPMGVTIHAAMPASLADRGGSDLVQTYRLSLRIHLYPTVRIHSVVDEPDAQNDTDWLAEQRSPERLIRAAQYRVESQHSECRQQ